MPEPTYYNNTEFQKLWKKYKTRGVSKIVFMRALYQLAIDTPENIMENYIIDIIRGKKK